MSNYVGYDGDFELPDEGVHLGVCVDIVDKVIDDQWNPGQTKVKTRIVFEIDVDHPKFDGNYTVSAFMTKSLHPKSVMRPFLEGWRGKKFTDEEAKRVDLEKLIGVPAQVQVIHNGGYANVAAVMPMAKGQEPFKPSGHYTRVKDREEAAEPQETASNGQAEVKAVQSDVFDDDLPF